MREFTPEQAAEIAASGKGAYVPARRPPHCREIKFRAWRKEESEWIYAEPVYGFFPSLHMDEESGRNIEDRYGNVQQYTGLKDKNGQEIYEGDIIIGETSYENANDERVWTREKPMLVEWNEQDAGFEPFVMNNRLRCDLVNIEIIGNIYENPELLSQPDEKEMLPNK
jgi:hypothetical protein